MNWRLKTKDATPNDSMGWNEDAEVRFVFKGARKDALMFEAAIKDAISERGRN